MAIALFQTDVAHLRPRIRERLAAVIESGRFVLGPEVEAFEAEFADYLGVRHVVGVANGTDAITIALRALGIQPRDEVVVPAFTFYATVEAAVNAGAVPVFCDIDPETRNVSVDTVRAVLSARTKAIIAVFGGSASHAIALAKWLGRAVAEHKQILLTGGGGPGTGSSAVRAANGCVTVPTVRHHVDGT